MCFVVSLQPPQWGTAGHQPDTAVDLAGAFVDWEAELSTRKNVFQIRTVRGLRVSRRLIAADIRQHCGEHWLRSNSAEGL